MGKGFPPLGILQKFKKKLRINFKNQKLILAFKNFTYENAKYFAHLVDIIYMDKIMQLGQIRKDMYADCNPDMRCSRSTDLLLKYLREIRSCHKF